MPGRGNLGTERCTGFSRAWNFPCEGQRMITVKYLACGLSLIGIAATMAHSDEASSEYVSPSEAVPRGKAPKMQVQLLNPGEPTKRYAVIFYQGDEAFSGMLEFAVKYHVTSAHFTAIGALNGATLGWFDPQRNDMALYQGKPVVHTHMEVGTSDGTTRAGPVLDAYVSSTLEVMVTVDPVAMQKRLDPATDGTLIDPALCCIRASKTIR